MKWIGISSFATRQDALPSKFPRRGFTLTELAIVLGVSGVILAGVWAAGSQMWENSRQQSLKTNISIIVKNMRSYYAGQRGISGTLTITPTLIGKNIIPGDLTRTGAGCGTVCADTPWGALTSAANGSLLLCAWQPGTTTNCTTGTAAGTIVQYFAIEVQAIPLSSCQTVAAINSGADSPPGLYDVVINGTSFMTGAGVTHQLPVDPQDAGTVCTDGATIDFVYRIAAPQSS